MSTEFSRLRQEQRLDQKQFQKGQSRIESKEFASVDDLLRHDSEQNPVPPEVGERLNNSLATEPSPGRPWYRRLFGGP